MTVLVSAVLIVRDEEAVLEDCLRSLDGVVDEIVIVDTGSQDSSPAIARRHGARLSRQEWHDDFAEARNVSLDRAKGEWLLYIDADERLVDTDRASLEATLVGADEIAFRVLLRPVSTMTPYREYRLWRNDPRIRFEGRMHERVVPAIHRVARQDGRPIGDADLFLEHIGYDGDQTRKHLRNLPLLRRFLEEDPEHLFALHHLAVVLEALGHDDEVDPFLERAIALVRRQARPHPVGSLSWADLIRRRGRRGEDVRPLLDEALALYPANCVLLFLDGRTRLEGEDFEAALGRFDEILRQAELPIREGTPAYSRRMIGELSHASRALCLFRLERYREAAESYDRAAAAAPEDPTYPIKRDLARTRAQRANAGGRSAEG
jgi:glycosyltransferase involved in cell wall biosynthesis